MNIQYAPVVVCNSVLYYFSLDSEGEFIMTIAVLLAFQVHFSILCVLEPSYYIVLLPIVPLGHYNISS